MVRNALSVQVWAGGHSGDSAEAVEFAELNGIDCVIEKYGLEDAQRAYGMFDMIGALPCGLFIVQEDKN